MYGSYCDECTGALVSEFGITVTEYVYDDDVDDEDDNEDDEDVDVAEFVGVTVFTETTVV